MVSRRLRGAAVAAVCALALSGCGSIHPGAAAQVGEVTISDEALKQSTTGFCEVIDVINRTQQGTNPPVPLRAAVLSALNTLVMGEALDQVAQRNDVEVTSSEVRQWVQALPLNFTDVPEDRIGTVQETMRRVGRNSLLVDKIGRAVYQQQNPGSSDVPPAEAQQLGQRAVDQYMRRAGVETDPRYGQVLDTQQLPGTGSVSIAVSEEGVTSRTVPEASNQLAKSRECA